MAAAPTSERTVRIVCSSLWKGRECGATVAIGEEHLPCDVCRGMERRFASDGPATRWAPPIAMRVLPAKEHGPELAGEAQAAILRELAADWAGATGSRLEADLL